MVTCAAYGCYKRSDKGKGKGISFFSFPNPRIKPEKKDLAARWLFNIGKGWTVKNYSFDNAKKVSHEHFEESCFETELQERLGFRIRKRLKPDAVPTIFSFKPTQMPWSTREKRKGPEAHKTKYKICYIQLLDMQDISLFRGYNKMSNKGREIKAHFTFVLDLFASARLPNLCIIYSIPPTSESYYSLFWLFV